MKIDFNAVNHTLLGRLDHYLRSWLPDGDVDSGEYVALNPTRNDTRKGSFRINMNTGAWGDFATGDKGGDPLSLYAYLYKNGSQYEAAKELAEATGLAPSEPAPEKKPRTDWEPIIPAPAGIELHIPNHPRHGACLDHWVYRTQQNEIIGAICRFDYEKINDKTGLREKHKDYFPLTWCRNLKTNLTAWRWVSFPKPRPLYGLHKLTESPDAVVMLVEGEKTADAAQKLFTSEIVMSWPGGAKAVKHTDYSPLYNRKVILWPDKDNAGYAAMTDVAQELGTHAQMVRFVMPPDDAPEGWDLADSTWSFKEAREYVRSHLIDKIEAPDPQPELPQAQVLQMPNTGPVRGEPPPPVEEYHREISLPFKVLGYDRALYYYMPGGTRTVLALSPAQHNKSHMLALAPLEYWEREFPTKKGCDWDQAQNYILRECERKGFFSPSLIRGRGAWHDKGGVVIHLGDKVLIGKKEYAPHAVPSKFIYEGGLTMEAALDNPLRSSEASKFADLLEMLPWDRPIYARLLAGWCVCAHVGGALEWRPHAWVTGRKGSGKTHVMSHIVRPILGDNCLFVQSESTAAGIRQTLAHDSLPVLFDEAEGEDHYALQRLQTILGLVRQSSSDTGGTIAKGSPTGKAQSYSIRSCFAFSSINASIVQQSDRSRVTVLELNQDRRQFEFADLVRAESDLLTDTYIRSFYARAIKNADVIRHNAQVYARVMAVEFGEQRAGDQIGTLLAGAYSLFSSKVTDFDTAQAWVHEQNWDEQRIEAQGQNDEAACFTYLMQQKLRVRVSSTEEDYPIGQLVDFAGGKGLSADLSHWSDKAKDYLNRSGIKVEHNYLYVSNTSPYIGRLLKDTPWSVNWGKVLKRLPGAIPSPMPVYFGFKGSEARCVMIPL